jgi:hypothetical protein
MKQGIGLKKWFKTIKLVFRGINRGTAEIKEMHYARRKMAKILMHLLSNEAAKEGEVRTLDIIHPSNGGFPDTYSWVVINAAEKEN